MEFTPSWYPKLVFSTNIPFPDQNTPLQNCFPSPGSVPSPLTVYPNFYSRYSHFMPYRMTPSVRHIAIEVHYYYLLLLLLHNTIKYNTVNKNETNHRFTSSILFIHANRCHKEKYWMLDMIPHTDWIHTVVSVLRWTILIMKVFLNEEFEFS